MNFLKKYRIAISENRILSDKVYSLNKELAKAKELLESAQDAKEKGCVRGQYCAVCAHSAMHSYGDYGVKCICTFGACDHFERWKAK